MLTGPSIDACQHPCSRSHARPVLARPERQLLVIALSASGRVPVLHASVLHLGPALLRSGVVPKGTHWARSARVEQLLRRLVGLRDLLHAHLPQLVLPRSPSCAPAPARAPASPSPAATAPRSSVSASAAPRRRWAVAARADGARAAPASACVETTFRRIGAVCRGGQRGAAGRDRQQLQPVQRRLASVLIQRCSQWGLRQRRPPS